MSSSHSATPGRRAVKLKLVSWEGITIEVRKMQWPQDKYANGYANSKILKTQTRSLFREVTSAALRMQYLDDDRDWVTLDKDGELDMALMTQKLRPLIVILFDKSKGLDEGARKKIILDNNLALPQTTVDKSAETSGNKTLHRGRRAKSKPMTSGTSDDWTENSDDCSTQVVGR